MHWACKKGDENLVKLLAGVARNIVNERSVSFFYIISIHAIINSLYIPFYPSPN